MNLRKLKNIALIVGLTISFGAIGGIQQETIPLFEGTVGMIVGVIFFWIGLCGRE